MKLLIVSATPHYLEQGVVVGLAPVAQEIDYLSSMFSEIRHVAPVHRGDAAAHMCRYESQTVRLMPLSPCGGLGLSGRISALKNLPAYLRTVRRAMPFADLVHVRCPANISLETVLMLATSRQPKPSWIKYGANWRPVSREPLSYRLQRLCLQTGWSESLVTVNGLWPGQPRHVHGLLNPSLSTPQLQRAVSLTSGKSLQQPIRLLFAGRLHCRKGTGRAVEILSALLDRDIDSTLDFAGDGPDRERLQSQIRGLRLQGSVRFHGWVSSASLAALYTAAHFVLLPSVGEGWPKVLSEGMAFGALPLAGAVSCIPQVLAQAKAGTAVQPHDIEAFVRAIEYFLRHPEQWRSHLRNGHTAARRFTYEAYVDRLRVLLALPAPRVFCGPAPNRLPA